MSEATRKRLLDVGVDTIRRSGYSGVSIKDIVKEAGIPKGSFHYYFDSKEAFGLAIIDHFGFLLGEKLVEPVLAESGLSAYDKLRLFFRRYSQLMEAEGYQTGCLVGLLAMEMSGSSEHIRMRTVEGFANFSAFLSTLIMQAQAQGDIDQTLDPTELASYLADTWEGSLLSMKAERSDRALKTFDRMVFDVFLKRQEPAEPALSCAS
ncbi:TetR family transcriptional regulator C-terminal domain-containing protein [Coralliovum pocilloporae]|uniref:TetR family transcriptional regulator C-terminal domain-containing protein n=1 Tax=Coralliovum pocilloporae TaxID=3066369 RepID=UPI0033075813